MLRYMKLLQPTTPEEAYDLAVKNKLAPLLAGGCWLRLGKRRWPSVIDLSGLPLRYIKETDTEFCIGAMATQGDVERYPAFQDWNGGILITTVQSILGVQFRNIATMGGSVAARFGFSDILPTLAALKAKVVLYKGGTMGILEYLTYTERDVLLEIRIPKATVPVATIALRKSVSDFPFLTGSMRKDETGYHVYIGCRPAQICEAVKAGQILTTGGLDAVTAAGEAAAQEVSFQTNSHASATYRAAMAKVLVKRLAQEVAAWK